MAELKHILIALSLALSLACFTNNPYPGSDLSENIYYSTFSEEPKHLDPARAYSSNQYIFMLQIYEPMLQYHFLKRPYQLQPLTLEKMPIVTERTKYTFTLKQGIRYQNHAAFAKKDNQYRYHLKPRKNFDRKIEHPNELEFQESKELIAADYIYQIKRLANPLLQCPIFGLFANYIQGLKELRVEIATEIAHIRKERKKNGGLFYNQEADEKENPIYIDLRKFSLNGVKLIDRYSYQITLSKQYPQFIYWLTMPFFAPVPWQVDRFFSQTATVKQNITLDRFPVGTGAFKLSVNKPNFRMVLSRNKNFHEEHYPSEGEPSDKKAGHLSDAGKRLPLLDKAIYSLEKESIPSWNKFLQGFFDSSAISADSFDKAIQVTPGGADLADSMKKKDIRLLTTIVPTTYYLGFNMLDETLGGSSEASRLLRRAISIAINIEEMIQIYQNDRGIAAQGPIPPGIFGYADGESGVNSYVYKFDKGSRKPIRRSIDEAIDLMTRAGYRNGIDKQTGRKLQLNLDTVVGSPLTRSRNEWLAKQLKKINIDLQIRETDYNQFLEKLLKGNSQIFWAGWHADYPDPENFLFLLYGPNGKVEYGGENAVNYKSAAFDTLFKKMENMKNGSERKILIKKIYKIIQRDAPWVWGSHEKSFQLYHGWYHNAKPMHFVSNSLKYKRVDGKLRSQQVKKWNNPIIWPLLVVVAIFIFLMVPLVLKYLMNDKGLSSYKELYLSLKSGQ